MFFELISKTQCCDKISIAYWKAAVCAHTDLILQIYCLGTLFFHLSPWYLPNTNCAWQNICLHGYMHMCMYVWKFDTWIWENTFVCLYFSFAGKFISDHEREFVRVNFFFRISNPQNHIRFFFPNCNRCATAWNRPSVSNSTTTTTRNHKQAFKWSPETMPFCIGTPTYLPPTHSIITTISNLSLSI